MLGWADERYRIEELMIFYDFAFSKSDEKRGRKEGEGEGWKEETSICIFFSIIKPFMKKMIILNDRGIFDHSPDTSCISIGNALRFVNPTLANGGSKFMQRDETTL